MTAINCTSIEDQTLKQLCDEYTNVSYATTEDVDTFFILWAAALVFFMHCGFAMLSAGAVRVKNTKNILMCIILDACVCCIAWWFLGWGFAYGGQDNAFIGTKYFVGIGMGVDYAYHEWFFQFAFAATAATIVSGAVAERASFEAYLTYSFFLSVWVYPVVVHWVWGGGFLTLGGGTNDPLFGVGAVDFAGCGPVHMIGGVAGAIGSKIIGPRIGRYDSQGAILDIPGHSSTLTVLGTFVLWVGWFGFNPGSALVITNNAAVAGRAAVNTMLASATGSLFALGTSTFMNPGREYALDMAANGCLAGLVAITAACAVVESWAALIIGAIGGVLYFFASGFTIKTLAIDDPLDATPVHLFCGAWGLIAVGFFAKTEYVMEVGGFAEATRALGGVFYAGDGSLLACQVIEILVIFAWVGAFMTPYFMLLQKHGWLRVSAEHEEIGLDQSHHGGHAYPELYGERFADDSSESNLVEGVESQVVKEDVPTASQVQQV